MYTTVSDSSYQLTPFSQMKGEFRISFHSTACAWPTPILSSKPTVSQLADLSSWERLESGSFILIEVSEAPTPDQEPLFGDWSPFEPPINTQHQGNPFLQSASHEQPTRRVPHAKSETDGAIDEDGEHVYTRSDSDDAEQYAGFLCRSGEFPRDEEGQRTWTFIEGSGPEVRMHQAVFDTTKQQY